MQMPKTVKDSFSIYLLLLVLVLGLVLVLLIHAHACVELYGTEICLRNRGAI
jgi:hypothetical protein